MNTPPTRFDVCDARNSGEFWKRLEVDLVFTAPPFFTLDQHEGEWVDLITQSLVSACSILKDDGALVVLLHEEGYTGSTRKVIRNMLERGFTQFGEDVWCHGGNMGKDEYDPIFYLSKQYRKPQDKEVFEHAAPPAARVRLRLPGGAHAVTWFGTMPRKLAESIIVNTVDALCAVVLDPFCGSGVIPYAATECGHAGYGSDLYPDVVTYARNNE